MVRVAVPPTQEYYRIMANNYWRMYQANPTEELLARYERYSKLSNQTALGFLTEEGEVVPPEWEEAYLVSKKMKENSNGIS